MKIKLSYDTKEEIPEGMDVLYTEKAGKWTLTGVEGMKTQDDVGKTTKALNDERAAHAATKAELDKFKDIDLEALEAEQSELAELRLKAGKGDKGPTQEEINELVEKRANIKAAKLQKELDAARHENANLKSANENLTGTIRTGKIHDHARKVAAEQKLVSEAVDDVLMYAERLFTVDDTTGEIAARDGVGVTPGISFEDWMNDMKGKRPHWWPTSVGGGAGGGGGGAGGVANNPWSKDSWNMTAQARYIKENGEAKAEAAAKAAGTFVGATAPGQQPR